MGAEFEWSRLLIDGCALLVASGGLFLGISGRLGAMTLRMETKIDAVREEAMEGRAALYDHLEKLYMPGGEIRAELKRQDHAIQEVAAMAADVSARLECPTADRRRHAGWPLS